MDEPLQRWRSMERLFREAIEARPEDRAAFVRERCEGDEDLARAVERLLAAHERSSQLTVGGEWELDGAAEPAANAASRVGQTLGVYELIEEIGRGGAATVYRARRTDGVFDRDVAIKVLRAPIEDWMLRERFAAERQILAKLDHPSIARVFDGGVTEDHAPYLVLELVVGEPIDDYCARTNAGLEERLELFRQVCEAVAYAHQRLVVHRDLKPSNILVNESGEVRLLDFGIAKLLDQEPRFATLSHADFVPMTPGFASPEQLRGEPVTTATDVYSLGALLYLLVTGRRPFATDLAGRLSQLLAGEEPPRASTAAARSTGYEPNVRVLEGDLDAIVAMALRVRQEDRYATVQELLDDLDRSRRGEPVRARQGTWLYLSNRWLRRNRPQLGVVAALLLIASLWAWSARSQSNEIRLQRDAAEVEAAKATAASDFLVGLFESADPSQSGSPDVTAREVLARGARRLQQDLETEPEVRVLVLESIANAYVQLGLPGDAIPLSEEALEIRGRLDGDRASSGRARLSLARALHLSGDLRGAAEAAARAAEECRIAAEGDPLCQGRALQLLGMLQSYTGDFGEAEATLGEALGVFTRVFGPEHQDTSMALHSLGVLASQQFEWERAADFFSQAHASEALGRESPYDAAVNANHLGTALLNLGRPAEALALHQEAHDRLVQLFGPLHAEVGGSLKHKGSAQLELGDLVGAEESVRQALEIQRELFPPGHPWITFGEVALAEVLAAGGRDLEAEQLFREATEGMRRTVPALVQRAAPLSSYAEFLLQRDRCREARPLLEEARDLAAGLPPESDVRRSIDAGLDRCGTFDGGQVTR